MEEVAVSCRITGVGAVEAITKRASEMASPERLLEIPLA